MEEQTKRSEKHGGVFLGVLVGVAATLLVTTKKGRNMLHNLSEEGLTKFGNWEHILKDVADAIEDDDDDYVPGEASVKKEVVHKIEQSPLQTHQAGTPDVPEDTSDYVPTVHQPSAHLGNPPPLREQPPWSPPPGTSQHLATPVIIQQPAAQPPLVHGEPVVHPSQEQTQNQVSQHTSHPISRPRTTSRRFFRGIPRR